MTDKLGDFNARIIEDREYEINRMKKTKNILVVISLS